MRAHGGGLVVLLVDLEQEYGRIMGIMSLSYMFGDAVIRIVFGLVLDAGLSRLSLSARGSQQQRTCLHG